MKGQVFGIRYLETAKNTPTFINMEAPYPNQLLTVVIWGDVRQHLPYKPEEVIVPKQGDIILFGKVEENKGKLQITVRNPDQLVFKYDTEVPFDKIPPIEKIQGN